MILGMMFTSAGGHFTVKPSQVINFFDPSSILIVIGCTMAVVVASFPPKMLKAMPKHFMIMTKQEIKEEYKQTEGDPLIKSKIREAQRKISQSRMMQQVPQADVVIRNPTHAEMICEITAAL